MKKKFRVRSNIEFQKIISKRKFVTDKSFAVYVKPKVNDYSRVGISIGKKLGNAVARNKVKRQVRMMLQELDSTKYNYDAIIMIRVKYHEFSYEDNKKQLELLLNRVKMKQWENTGD